VPELPEVEILARHLAPLLLGKTIRAIEVRRAKVLRPTSARQLAQKLVGAKFIHLRRRGKYLLFDLKKKGAGQFTCLGHLGMTGRMFLQPHSAELPKHTALVLDLGKLRFVYEDTRYFGRFTLDTKAVESLGPEPLSADFTTEGFALALKRSAQPVKVKLLDQSLVAGVGNIYASEALFRAKISPRRSARSLKRAEVERLHMQIRVVLQEAIVPAAPSRWILRGRRQRTGCFTSVALPTRRITMRSGYWFMTARANPASPAGGPSSALSRLRAAPSTARGASGEALPDARPIRMPQGAVFCRCQNRTPPSTTSASAAI